MIIKQTNSPGRPAGTIKITSRGRHQTAYEYIMIIGFVPAHTTCIGTGSNIGGAFRPHLTINDFYVYV